MTYISFHIDLGTVYNNLVHVDLTLKPSKNYKEFEKYIHIMMYRYSIEDNQICILKVCTFI